MKTVHILMVNVINADGRCKIKLSAIDSGVKSQSSLQLSIRH